MHNTYDLTQLAERNKKARKIVIKLNKTYGIKYTKLCKYAGTDANNFVHWANGHKNFSRVNIIKLEKGLQAYLKAIQEAINGEYG